MSRETERTRRTGVKKRVSKADGVKAREAEKEKEADGD
jgi:hypothetical protein